jgi:hypothetical protein
MASSTNYLWSEPDDTSLVKNGALAIRTLGNAIDTTMATKAVASNPIINSAFDIFQRSSTPTTGITTTGGINYTLDRWMARTAGGGGSVNVSQQAAGNLSVTPTQAIRYCARVQRVAGNTDTNGIGIYQTMETANSVQFAGKTLTLSFYARKGTNYSASGNTITVELYSGTGTDQVWYSFTGSTAIASSGTNVLTSSWQRFTITGTAPTNMTEMYASFTYAGTGTAGAADYFEVTGVQIDIGSVVLPFKTASGGSIQGELAMCKRYLPSVNVSSTGSNTTIGYAYTTNSGIFPITFDVQARVGPTGITTPTVNTTNFTVRNKSNGDATITSLAFDVSGVNGATVLAGATLTSGDVCRLIVNNASYILFTGCEL